MNGTEGKSRTPYLKKQQILGRSELLGILHLKLSSDCRTGRLVRLRMDSIISLFYEKGYLTGLLDPMPSGVAEILGPHRKNFLSSLTSLIGDIELTTNFPSRPRAILGEHEGRKAGF